jgi:hypothetical protein
VNEKTNDATIGKAVKTKNPKIQGERNIQPHICRFFSSDIPCDSTVCSRATAFPVAVVMGKLQ